MKFYTCFLAVISLSCSLAHSDEGVSHEQVQSSVDSNFQRFYFGPDVFVYHVKDKYSSENEVIRKTAHSVLGGLRLGYDYLKPQTLYFGIDGIFALGKLRQEFKSACREIFGDQDEVVKFNTKVHSRELFANIEQRYGYTFQSPLSAKASFIPFAGIGWYHMRSKIKEENLFKNWFYGAAGLRTNYHFADNFDLGLNVKAMYAFAGKIKNIGEAAHFSWKEDLKHFWGYEIAFPFSWKMGTGNTWDIQFQPYLLKLDTNEVSEFFGVRFQAGYSF